MLPHSFHSSPGVFLRVNFALFNAVISSRSAKPVAPVRCRNCFSPQFLPGAREGPLGGDERAERPLSPKSSAGNGYASFPELPFTSSP